ncbi:TetR/AcrR family transcriptional regulator C-terminal domain-containing protein [Cryptosporangium sp. NPDC048952]|uniref:TetR/AcrR family transcriptional regulator C-terminal domain-containing protein n=1 Tax=Cryptosporangium sp. NPDC048952 TaxID=3363961 RepID=UPI0037100F09
MADAGLPPVVARMWGRDTAARYGPRPSQDVRAIVDAAIAIADREGLDKVTMSSVAADVGVATMSLYRYVGSKDELLLLMADAAAPEPPALEAQGWRAYLTAWTRANRDYLLGRPWQLTLGRTAPPAGPRTLRWLDRALAALADTGLTHTERINIATTLTGYASQQASVVVAMLGAAAAPPRPSATGTSGPGATAGPRGGPRGGSPALAEPIDGLVDYGRILGELLEPEEYPALSAAVAENAFGAAPDWIDDADFQFGLDLLLDGIEALIARRNK